MALLMLGLIAGCTQPASINTLRSCVAVGQTPAERLSGTLALRLSGSKARTD